MATMLFAGGVDDDDEEDDDDNARTKRLLPLLSFENVVAAKEKIKKRTVMRWNMAKILLMVGREAAARFAVAVVVAVVVVV